MKVFKRYTLLEQVYLLARKLAYIYQHTKDKAVDYTKLAQWYDEVEKSGIKSFKTIKKNYS